MLASPELNPLVTSAVEEPAVVDSWAELDWFEKPDSKVEISVWLDRALEPRPELSVVLACVENVPSVELLVASEELLVASEEVLASKELLAASDELLSNVVDKPIFEITELLNADSSVVADVELTKERGISLDDDSGLDSEADGEAVAE